MESLHSLPLHLQRGAIVCRQINREAESEGSCEDAPLAKEAREDEGEEKGETAMRVKRQRVVVFVCCFHAPTMRRALAFSSVAFKISMRFPGISRLISKDQPPLIHKSRSKNAPNVYLRKYTTKAHECA